MRSVGCKVWGSKVCGVEHPNTLDVVERRLRGIGWGRVFTVAAMFKPSTDSDLGCDSRKCMLQVRRFHRDACSQRRPHMDSRTLSMVSTSKWIHGPWTSSFQSPPTKCGR